MMIVLFICRIISCFNSQGFRGSNFEEDESAGTIYSPKLQNNDKAYKIRVSISRTKESQILLI